MLVAACVIWGCGAEARRLPPLWLFSGIYELLAHLYVEARHSWTSGFIPYPQIIGVILHHIFPF